MSEVVTIDRWLYQTLHGDATLMALVTGVVADVAPPGLACPFLVYALQDGADVGTVNGVRIMTRATYHIRIVTDSESFVAIEPAVNQLDALLHRASGDVTGQITVWDDHGEPVLTPITYGTIISCVRTDPFRYTELVSGKMYRHLGGFYEIQVQAQTK